VTDNPYLAARLQSAADALARVMTARTGETWIGIVKPDTGDDGASLLERRLDPGRQHPVRAYDSRMDPDRKKLVDRYRADKRDMEQRGLLLPDSDKTGRLVAQEVDQVREEMWREKNAE
jgi:hypothetical protein